MSRSFTARGAEKGSILLETLMVIPLFIAFFSGIVLLGDLESGRNRLNAADRFAVWLGGCRFADKRTDEVKEDTSKSFFGEDSFDSETKLKSFRLKKLSANWYALCRGSAELKMVLPAWASGTRKGALELLAGDDAGGPEKKMWDDISFKARETDGNETHTVLMRTKYASREQPARILASSGRWYMEYRTPYVTREGALSDAPRGSSGGAVTSYSRLGLYELWSR